MNSDKANKIFPISSTDSKYYLILFMLWPFLAFLTAVSNYSRKESKRVVYIFLIYFGLTFVIRTQGYADAAGYASQLKINSLLPFSDFFKIVSGIYSNETSVDIVEPLISFIVSRFTSDYRILFAVYAAMFGFFYLKSINLLYNRYQENPTWNAFIYMAFFTMIIPITSINGVRMWTASWIFFLGAYHAVLFREPKYLLVALSASLVHFSFLSANAILIIYYFAGNRNFIYLPIALASFIVPHFIAPFLQTISIMLGGGLQHRFEGYTSEENVLIRQSAYETASWFIKIGNNLVLYYYLIAIIFIQIRYRKLMNDKPERNLFSFLILFLAFVNFGMSIPSFGSRFQIVFFLFATLYVYLFFLKMPKVKLHLLTWLALFPMLLYTVVLFRTSSGCINTWLFTPGFGLPFLVPGISLYDLLFH
jgi:hypothetical protein